MTQLLRNVVSLAFLLSVAQPAMAVIFLVTDTYDATDANGGDGICADANGRCTLRAAVQESNALAGADIIVLPAGTYTLSITGNAEHAAARGDLDLLDDVTLRGQGADRTVIDAAGVDRVLEAIDAGTVLIENLTIENGVAGTNSPGFAAANSGGAIATVGNTSTLTLRGVVMRNNQARSGGGLYNIFSTVEIYNSTIHDNIATIGSGGGIAEGLATYTRLYNVTLSGNMAAQNGGGMSTSNNTALFYNVTATGNLADSDANGSGDGGGLFNGITAATLVNSILAGNRDNGGEAPDCTDSITSQGYNLIGDDAGCAITPAAGDQIGSPAAPIDPGLQPLAVAENGVALHALANISPAIDAANPAVPGSGGAACLDTDARGANRALNTPCDIGAFEVASYGRTLVVNNLNDQVDATPGDGVCETAAGNLECTLRAAIQEANVLDGMDSIVIPAGTITLTLAGVGENLSATGDLDITEATRIVGAGMSQTIVDAAALDRVFHLSTTGRVEIQALTIRNGSAGGSSGGGILLENNGGLDLTDVRISGNNAQHGGGLYAALWSWMEDGMVNLTRCVISGNTAAAQGGGYANFTFRTSTITATTLSGNTAQVGGGLFNSFMSMALVTGSTISGNQAQSGGGISLQFGRGVVTLVNSTVSGNTATSVGGGIHVPATDHINLFSSTVSGNRAAGVADGGGIYANGAVRLGNSVLAGNSDDDATAPDCSATLDSLGYNLIGTDAGCTISASTGDQIGTVAAPIDPRLDSLATHGDTVAYHRPFDDSPVLNAGNPAQPGSGGASCPRTDQRGVDRLLNAPCDIGATELQVADVAVTAAVTPANVIRAGQMNYAFQVTNAGPDTATGLSLTLTPTTGSGYVAASGAGWTCGASGSDIVCQGADLANGAASDLLLTFTAPDSSGTLASTVSITTESWDVNTANNSVQFTYTSNAPPSVTGLSRTSFTGTADSALIAAGITLSDIDSATLAYATLRFMSGFVSGEDLLYLSVYSGLTASWDAVNGVLTISGIAPLSTYQTVLRNARYTNLADTATSGNRLIEVVVSDGVFESTATNMQLSLTSTDASAPISTPISTPTSPPSGGLGNTPTDVPLPPPSTGGGLGSLPTQHTDPAEAENSATQAVETQTAIAANEAAVVDPEQTELSAQDPTQDPTQDSEEDSQPQDAQDSSLVTHASSVGARAGSGQHVSTTTAQPLGSPNNQIEVASIASAEFWEEIASMRAQMAAEEALAADDPQQLAYTAAKTMTVFLFAGATNWYLKGSALLASLFSSLPLWTQFDPLPILALNRRMRRRRERTQAAAAAMEQRYSTGMTRLLDARAGQVGA